MANGSPHIKKVIKSLGSSKTAPAASIISEVGLNKAALISKLVKPAAFAETAKNDRETANVVSHAEMKRVSDFIGKKKKDSENITKLFPDVELAKQIYTSSVIAPKDMTSTEILYTQEDPLFPADLVVTANECIKANVEDIHHLNDDLQDIIRESLFETGSYVVAVLPESTIDEVINNDRTFSLESASVLYNEDGTTIKPLGYLGDFNDTTDKSALESFFNGSMDLNKLKTNAIVESDTAFGIEVYDNYEMLKVPKLLGAISSRVSSSIIRNNPLYRRSTTATGNVAAESTEISNNIQARKDMNIEEIRSLTFKTPVTANSPVITLKTKESAARRSIGRALRMKIPSESVVPVYPPGEPDHHVGYFILLDINGAPLTTESERGYNDGITSMMNNNIAQNQSTGLNSYLLKKAKDTLIGNEREPTVTDMSRVYASIVERKIATLLKNGLHKKEMAVGDSEEIYRMMMFRALQGKQTRMLYVPSELITYYAYRYHTNGVGKSMLDDMTMLISTRAVTMVARVMQQIRSSINCTNVGVTLDAKDPDPEKTMELTVANVMKHLQFQMPVGLVTQADLYEWVARAGVRFSFDGHPGLPDLKYDFTNDTIGNTIPDTDLEEDLRRRTYMAFGLSPEQVDNSLSPDFATSVLANNALLSKRVMNTQVIYTRHMTADAKRIMRHDMVAYDELREIIRKNLGTITARIKDNDNINETNLNNEELITELTERYIDNIKLDLPKPDLTTIENQLDSIEKAESIVDKYLESYVSTEAYPSMVSGDAGGMIDEYKGMLKAAIMRDWIANNPSFKDLSEILARNLDKDGKTTLFDLMKNHSEGFVHSMLKFTKDAKPFANAASRDVEQIQNDETLPADQAAGGEGGEVPAETENSDAAADGSDTGGGAPAPKGEDNGPVENTDESAV